MGLTMDNYVNFQNQQSKLDKILTTNIFMMNYYKLTHSDYYGLGKVLKTVKAVIPSHTHLDHVGCTLWYEVF